MVMFSTGDKPTKLPKNRAYDINEKRFYSMSYRPKNWVANQEVIKNAGLVIPTVPNGFYYECSSSGNTDAVEPVFLTTLKSKTPDNTAEWTAKIYDFLLNTGDTITSSTWTGTNGETVDSESIVDGIQTKFRLTSVAADAKTVTLVNHIAVSRLNGDVEEFDRSIIIPVKVL